VLASSHRLVRILGSIVSRSSEFSKCRTGNTHTDARELSEALLTHREQTHAHIERLEQVFEIIGKRAQTKPCEAIKGIIAEGDESGEDFGTSEAIDAGLIAAGQAVEHYEMARYGALVAWAKQLGMRDAASLLTETFNEEKKADQLLSQLALGKANKKTA
jgi:ferritin-like metal-binding protein YciE